jgi:hypothetical protein
MTRAERKYLRKARDEGSLIIGGSDQSVPRPHMDVCVRLVTAGYLQWGVPKGMYEVCAFQLTEKGKEAVNALQPEQV